MLKEHDYVFRRLSMGLDLLLVAVSVAVALLVRNEFFAPYLAPGWFPKPARATDLTPLLLGLPPVAVFVLRANGYYKSMRTKTPADLAKPVILAALASGLAGMVLGFLQNRGATVSRGVALLTPPVMIVVLMAKTIVVREVLRRVRRLGYNWRSLALVGDRNAVLKFVEVVQGHPYWGFRLEGALVERWDGEETELDGVPIAGPCEDLPTFLQTHAVDEVVFLSPDRPLSELSRYFEICEEMGIKSRLALQFFQPSIARPTLDTFEHLALLTYSPTTDLHGALLFKHAFDRIASLMLLVLFSPVFILTALLIKLTSASLSDPIFYGQKRCGLNGREFTMWKFRTMVVGADKIVHTLQQQNEMGGPVFKMKNDPRITLVGRWLRRLSIDELPQLYNVLIGDMSLVGPRPPLPREVAAYDRWQRRRLSMKPGITCLWQVSGRNTLSFDTWMKLDLEYIDNWSLSLDFKILLRTVYAVTTGHGAM